MFFNVMVVHDSWFQWVFMVFVLFKFTIVNDARPSGPLYAVISDGRKKSIQRCDVFDGSFKSIGAAWYLVVQGFYAYMNLKKKWRFGWLLPMCYSLPDSQTTKYRAAQLV